MLSEPLRIYKDYQFVPNPILSATNFIEIYFKEFLESISYVWAHKDINSTTYRQTKTARRTARKFLANVV